MSGRHRAPESEPALLIPYPREPVGEPWEGFDSGNVGTTTLRSVDLYQSPLDPARRAAARHAVDWLAQR